MPGGIIGMTFSSGWIGTSITVGTSAFMARLTAVLNSSRVSVLTPSAPYASASFTKSGLPFS